MKSLLEVWLVLMTAASVSGAIGDCRIGITFRYAVNGTLNCKFGCVQKINRNIVSVYGVLEGKSNCTYPFDINFTASFATADVTDNFSNGSTVLITLKPAFFDIGINYCFGIFLSILNLNANEIILDNFQLKSICCNKNFPALNHSNENDNSLVCNDFDKKTRPELAGLYNLILSKQKNDSYVTNTSTNQVFSTYPCMRNTDLVDISKALFAIQRDQELNAKYLRQQFGSLSILWLTFGFGISIIGATMCMLSRNLWPSWAY